MSGGPFDTAASAPSSTEGAAPTLAQLSDLAREAGEAILAHYGDPGSSAGYVSKPDESPLTAADTAAHAVIVSGLRSLAPGIPCISEEGDVPPFDERRRWERFWLVDPLDGTKEFLKRNGEFTVNIALIAGGAPVLGVVFAPSLDLLYCAGRGLGAWKQAGGRTAPLTRITSRPPEPGAPVSIVESRSHPSAALEEFLRTIHVGRRVQVGSSLKFCWVAEGLADVYPRLGDTMEWDVAAGDCVFRSSAVEGERRSPLGYNTPSLRNSGFVIGLE